MAANGANDAAVRGFLHQLLHSIVRQIENNDGRGDNGDGVLYRVDWLYNCLVRYVGSYNIDENIDLLVGRSRDMLEDIVNAHSNSDNNGGDKPTQLLSTCFSQLRVWLERVCLLRICFDGVLYYDSYFSSVTDLVQGGLEYFAEPDVKFGFVL